MPDSEDPLSEFTVVQVQFDPYSHSDFQKFLRAVHREFGASGPKRAWQWAPTFSLDGDVPGNAWHVNFYWRDPRMATLFALKYQG